MIGRCARKILVTLVLLAGVLATAVVPSVALADQRSGSGTDAVADTVGGAPAQDIVAADASYDTSGQLVVTTHMAGDVATGPPSTISVAVLPSSNGVCAGSGVTMTGDTNAASASYQVKGVDAGSAATAVVGSAVSFTASGPTVAGLDLSCLIVVVSPLGDPATAIDQLTAPVYFLGYGPDSDSDGIKDNLDACPTAAGPAPDGCPPGAKTGPDKTAPEANLGGDKKQKLGPTITIKIKCDEACRARTSGTVTIPRRAGVARKRLTIAAVTRSLAKNRTVNVRVRLSLRSRSAIRAALAHGVKITAQLTVRVTDAAGNARTLRRNVKLRG